MSQSSLGRIDIIIPTYNGGKRLVPLLESIQKQTYREYACFVIDDGSPESCAEYIMERFPWVRFIQQTANYGPAHNRNLAAGRGSSPYICLFDDDIYLPDPDWLGKAHTIMSENENIGQIATRIMSAYDEEVLIDCGIHEEPAGLFKGVFARKHVDHVFGKHLTKRPVLGACSASSMVRRDVFERVRGFDAKYYYFAEDLDLSIRIYLAGYDIVYCPSLSSCHMQSATMRERPEKNEYFSRRNRLLVILENYPRGTALRHFLALTDELILSLFRSIPLRGLKRVDWNETKSALIVWGRLVSWLPRIIRKRRIMDRIRKRPRKSIIELNRRLASETDLCYPVRVVIFSITNKCNAACPMCFQHEAAQKNASSISVDAIRRLFQSMRQLENVTLGGGEPFLRDDLDEICTSLLDVSPRVGITIATNGSFPGRLYHTSRNILSYGAGNLLVSLSLDGSREYHDTNRSVPGLFEKVSECYDGLSDLRAIYGARLELQINTCVTRGNLSEIDFLHDYLAGRMPDARWVLEPVRGNFDPSTTSPLSLAELTELQQKLLRFSGKPIRQTKPFWIDAYQAAIDTIRTEAQVVKCYGGREIVALDHDGRIRPCETKEMPLISLEEIDYNVNSLLGHARWQDAVRSIEDGQCHCTHFCWLGYSMARNARQDA